MGHVSSGNMCAAVSGDKPAWTNTNLSEREIRQVFSKYTCISCATSKRNLDPPTDRSQEERRNWKPGEAFSCDPAVKINPKGYDGSDCYFLFKDLATGYLHAILSDSKQSSAFIEAFNKVLLFYAKHNCKRPTTLRTDSEPIFLSKEVHSYLEEKFIDLNTSAPERHFQNSVERDMQTVIKGVAAVLHGQPFLRLDLWPAALLDFIEKKNRTPNKRCYPYSPYQIITKNSTKLNNQFKFKFGEVVIVGIPKINRDSKFDIRNDIGIYIGQELGMVDTHRVYYPHTNSYHNRGSVSKLEATKEQLQEWFAKRIENKQPVYKQVAEAYHNLLSDSEVQQEELPTININNDLSSNEINDENILNSLTHEEKQLLNDPEFIQLLKKFTKLSLWKKWSDEQSSYHPSTDMNNRPPTPPSRNNKRKSKFDDPPPTSNHRMPLRDRTGSKGVQVLSAERLASKDILSNPMISEIYFPIYCNSAKGRQSANDPLNDSPSVKKALQSENREEWIQAIRKEVGDLMKKTFKKIDTTKLDPNSYIRIKTTMQLKRKRNSTTGEIDKYKARECARGDLLKFDERMKDIATYSPTVSALTFSLILQVATIRKMKKRTSDTVSAFTAQGYPAHLPKLILKLDKDIADVCGLDPDQEYQIAMYLYGLPDASRAYYDAYKEHLCNNGYKVSSYEPCLFYRITEEEETYISIHVDDTFIFSNSEAALNRFANIMQTRFQITIDDAADAYLGIHLIEDKTTGNVKLHQPKLLQSLLETYEEQLKSPPVSITASQYQQLLGTLMYLTKSRPDIQASISFAATHAKDPSIEHYRQLLGVVEYIQKTQQEGLIIHSYEGSNKSKLQLYCHVDASYLTHEDSKSQTGYTLSFGKVGCFYAKSSKQPLVATSSTHAEARALFTLLQDIIYVISICQELGIELQMPVQIYEDNFPVVQLTNNLAPRTKKCKHFLMLINYIKEQVEKGIINIQHIDTDENLADILTKLLTGNPYITKAQKLLGNSSDNIGRK